MNRFDPAHHREAVAAWARAGAALDQLRRQEIRESDASGVRAVIPTMELMDRLGVKISAETGLVEQQRWFARLRHG
ncbi:MAG: hypothetical protein HZA93_21800 [Verrucomicrobia bacterium]|nr:hypothetical protein [Verrucomicrobiota bacterium]